MSIVLRGIWRVASAIGCAFGALSLVVLVWQAWDIGLSSAAGSVTSWYRDALHAVLNPLDPAAREFSSRLNLGGALSAEWQHLVVLGIALPAGLGLAAAEAKTFIGRFCLSWNAGTVFWVCLLFAAFPIDHGRLSATVQVILAAILSPWAIPIGVHLGKSVNPNSERWSLRDSFRGSVYLMIVLGGACLFAAMNAGLKVMGM